MAEVHPPPTLLRNVRLWCYVMSGTDIGYAATRCPIIDEHQKYLNELDKVAPDAMSGTDTSSLRDVRY
eukprot:1130297-Rhodomonas_salina.7